jgi:hypothetical protein
VPERPSNVAAEAPRTLEDVVEAVPVDVEGDLVRVRRGAARLRAKEDEQHLAHSKWLVVALQLLGTGQIEVEAAQDGWIGGPTPRG